jgi:hypothetical protein
MGIRGSFKMITKMMNARGVLKPANPDTVEEDSAEKIRAALGSNGFWWLMHETMGESGIIDLHAGIDAEGDHFPDSFTESEKAWLMCGAFIAALKRVIQTAGVEELGLEGSLMITVDSDESPLVVRVTVKDNKLFYKKATLTWDEEDRLY